VVAEWVVDMVSLRILLAMVIIVQFKEMLDFMHSNPEIASKIYSVIFSPLLIAVAIAGIIAIIIFRKTLSHTLFYKKISAVVANLREGFVSVGSIRQKGWFIFYSAFIWILYYLMLYVVFFSFDFTSHLSPVAGLTTFVLASFGMVAPVQGGIGAWHFMAIEALSLYGIAKQNGLIFAFVAHTSMTLMMIILGLASLIILPFINRRNKIINSPAV
jgi:glycosyltransferase 2 family protein